MWDQCRDEGPLNRYWWGILGKCGNSVFVVYYMKVGRAMKGRGRFIRDICGND